MDVVVGNCDGEERRFLMRRSYTSVDGIIGVLRNLPANFALSKQRYTC